MPKIFYKKPLKVVLRLLLFLFILSSFYIGALNLSPGEDTSPTFKLTTTIKQTVVSDTAAASCNQGNYIRKRISDCPGSIASLFTNSGSLNSHTENMTVPSNVTNDADCDFLLCVGQSSSGTGSESSCNLDISSGSYSITGGGRYRVTAGQSYGVRLTNGGSCQTYSECGSNGKGGCKLKLNFYNPGPPPPSCGAQGQACCSGVNCNAGLTCQGGSCQPPCGAQGQTCCGGVSCNGGLTCQGGVCNPPPAAPSIILYIDGTAGTSGAHLSNHYLSWAVSGTVNSCAATGSWGGGKAASGAEYTGALGGPGTYYYYLTCTGPGGTDSKVVYVTIAEPLVVNMSIDGVTNASGAYGSDHTINWYVSGAWYCNASGNWSGAKPGGYQAQTTGGLAGPATYSYTLSCTGPSGSDSRTVTVAIAAASPPVITLYIDGAASSTGQHLSNHYLSWSVGGVVSWCQADGSWSGPRGVSGGEYTGALGGPGTYYYGLTCAGPGGSDGKTVSVTINSPPPQPFNFTVAPYANGCAAVNTPKISMSWSNSAYATNYRVRRYNAWSGENAAIYSGGATSIDDYDNNHNQGSQVLNGNPYGYLIIAENWQNPGVETYANGNWSHAFWSWTWAANCAPPPPPPIVINAPNTYARCIAANQPRIRVTWSAVTNAAYYQVYRADLGWITTNTTATSIEDGNITSNQGQPYTYYVRAISPYGYASEWSTVAVTTLNCNPPSAFTQYQPVTFCRGAGNSSNYLSWQQPANTTNFWLAIAGNPTWISLGNVLNNWQQSLNPEQQYNYIIVAQNGNIPDSSGYTYSDGGSWKAVTTLECRAPGAFTVSNIANSCVGGNPNNGQPQLTTRFTKSAFATYYRIQQGEIRTGGGSSPSFQTYRNTDMANPYPGYATAVSGIPFDFSDPNYPPSPFPPSAPAASNQSNQLMKYTDYGYNVVAWNPNITDCITVNGTPQCGFNPSRVDIRFSNQPAAGPSTSVNAWAEVRTKYCDNEAAKLFKDTILKLCYQPGNDPANGWDIAQPINVRATDNISSVKEVKYTLTNISRAGNPSVNFTLNRPCTSPSCNLLDGRWGHDFRIPPDYITTLGGTGYRYRLEAQGRDFAQDVGEHTGTVTLNLGEFSFLDACTPWTRTLNGDVHANGNIDVRGGP